MSNGLFSWKNDVAFGPLENCGNAHFYENILIIKVYNCYGTNKNVKMKQKVIRNFHYTYNYTLTKYIAVHHYN